MGLFYLVWLIIISLPFLVLSGACVFYFILGIRSYITGRAESSRRKINGAIISMVVSLAGMTATYFLWRFSLYLMLDENV